MSADQPQQQYVGHNSSTQAAVLAPAAMTLTLSLLLYATRIRARRSSPFIWTDGMIAAALTLAISDLILVAMSCHYGLGRHTVFVLVKMPFAVKALDHVVLTCRNINATVKFYNLLGMKHEVFHSSKDAPGVERIHTPDFLFVEHETQTISPSSKLTPSSKHRHALSFGQQKLNLHQAGAEFEPKATLAKPGTADLCFITTTPITEVLAELQKEGLEILEEGKVVDRVGAVGKLKSVYTRDPDGNLIEVSNYV
ncbi:hypothetical protein KCU71_g7622, partial [Aureobasidium melanogenum]